VYVTELDRGARQYRALNTTSIVLTLSFEKIHGLLCLKLRRGIHQLWFCLRITVWRLKVPESVCQMGTKAADQSTQTAYRGSHSIFAALWRSALLDRTVTGNEMWLQHLDAENKRRTMGWKHPRSPLSPLPKILLTFFWDRKGPILEHYQEKGQNVNNETYPAIRKVKFKPAVRNNRRGLLSNCSLASQQCSHRATFMPSVHLQRH
jgi:hypothetical protein